MGRRFAAVFFFCLSCRALAQLGAACQTGLPPEHLYAHVLSAEDAAYRFTIQKYKDAAVDKSIKDSEVRRDIKELDGLIQQQMDFKRLAELWGLKAALWGLLNERVMLPFNKPATGRPAIEALKMAMSYDPYNQIVVSNYARTVLMLSNEKTFRHQMEHAMELRVTDEIEAAKAAMRKAGLSGDPLYRELGVAK